MLSLFNVKTLSSESLTQVNTMINDSISDPTRVSSLAELFYLQRRIDVLTQYYESDRAITSLKDLYKDNQSSFAVTKYYVKAIINQDEFQMCSEEKDRYEMFKLAEALNTDQLVKIHKHKKETIDIQLKRLINFRQFMTSNQ